jgi:membrane protein
MVEKAMNEVGGVPEADPQSHRTQDTYTATLLDLVNDLFQDLATLVRQEIQLVRTELTEKLMRPLRSGVALVSGGMLAFGGLVTVLVAAMLGGALWLPFWLAACLIGLVVLILGLIVIQIGRQRLQQIRWLPETTVASLRTDAAVLTGADSADARTHRQRSTPTADATQAANQMPSWWQVVKEVVNEWRTDEASQLAAALAYYTAVSIAPLLVLIVVVVGLWLGQQTAQEQLLARLQSTLGAEGAGFLQTVLENAQQPTLATVAGILSVLTLLWSSTNLFSQLQTSLNRIWNVKPKPGRGIWGTLKDRFLSFTLVLGIAFLLLVSLVLSAVLSTLGEWGQGWLPGADWLWQAVNFVVSFAVTTGLFAAIYKVLPDAEITWRDVGLGAAVTALLFTVGKFLLGLYLANAGSAYGTVGSVVVFLLWVYYSAQILFLGAEFTQVYARNYGSGIQPAANAERTPDHAPA